MELHRLPSSANQSLHLTTATTTDATDFEKAWHVLGLLISLGRPASPNELASSCTLFYLTPEEIQFLCLIPESPLRLISNQLVTFSPIGWGAFARFYSNLSLTLNELVVPRELGFCEAVGRSWWRGLSEGDDVLKTYCRKRKRVKLEMDDSMMTRRREHFADRGNRKELALFNRDWDCYPEVHFLDENDRCTNNDQSALRLDHQKLEKIMFMPSLSVNYYTTLLHYGPQIDEYHNEETINMPDSRKENGFVYIPSYHSASLNLERSPHVTKTTNQEEITDLMTHRETLLLTGEVVPPATGSEAPLHQYIPSSEQNFNGVSCFQLAGEMTCSQIQANTVAPAHTVLEDATGLEARGQEPICEFNVTGASGGCVGNQLFRTTHMDTLCQLIDTTDMDRVCEGNPELMISKSGLPLIIEEKTKAPLQDQATSFTNVLFSNKQQLSSSSLKPKVRQKDVSNVRRQTISKLSKTVTPAGPLIEEQQSRKDEKQITLKQNLMNNIDQKMDLKEKRCDLKEDREKSTSISLSNTLDEKALPTFESFTVEEEEGSGGYGTVYRARRKCDGVTLAIKCPHKNANKHHVQNEVKMLERFGGKNFVIKYEGSFKRGNSDCLVLEYVEHDRPEVLKKEIDLFQLRWYGYCLFKALAGLHRQGIVHRDVKPGNFLFSRKANKGYLIDFNLALDLYHKYGTTDKSKIGNNVSFDHDPLRSTKSLPSTKFRKFLGTKTIGENQNTRKESKTNLPKDMRMKVDQAKHAAEVSSRNIIKSQGADGSGITSAKDASTKTPSGERFREPMPLQGRKELISLVQEALQGANHEPSNYPLSKRKRVAAPPSKVDRKFVHLTPMPLLSNGTAIAGAGSLKDGKHKREGPCVGTKGFRAPEVLFRSLHQGPKLDIWSVGVTLLYLMTGRMPFAGDPNQNIKEIAKMKGSEDLWEVAKLHNCESSFPMDLLDIQFLQSVKLREWCQQNTRRPDFLDLVPRSLFDLIDKCLAVNPRLRISAEEALKHEFFAPCHEALRKHRLQRQGSSIDSRTAILTDGQSQACQVS